MSNLTGVLANIEQGDPQAADHFVLGGKSDRGPILFESREPGRQRRRPGRPAVHDHIATGRPVKFTIGEQGIRSYGQQAPGDQGIVRRLEAILTCARREKFHRFFAPTPGISRTLL
jgi:hypothetical protein